MVYVMASIDNEIEGIEEEEIFMLAPTLRASISTLVFAYNEERGLMIHYRGILVGRSHGEYKTPDNTEKGEEALFQEETRCLSGFSKGMDLRLYYYYVPHLRAAEQKYFKLQECRTKQRSFVKERVLLVKQIDEVSMHVLPYLQ